MKKQDKPKVKMAIKDVYRKSDSLMNESLNKKLFANQQIKYGNALIKLGIGGKVRVIDAKGTTTPTAQKRISDAKNLQKSAKMDSLQSVKLRNQIKKK
jgi:hypothetical protein